MRRVIAYFFAAMLLQAPVYAENMAATAPIAITVHTKSGTLNWHAEVAANQESREIGLMNRDSVGAQDGMLFLFPNPPAPHAFWMKNTHISLDLLFIDAQGKITKIYANAAPESLIPMPSQGPVSAVLEIAGGRAAKSGIAQGDTITYSVPDTVHVE